ncbi:Hypothetical predicted protein [Lecanosticta acicola]|uniref:Thioesterase domain-containing protein n=1 Tax=Lecanosticta acicola TaxID=111012 RepID=A0AAI9E7H6_9PEZI|nr:Hypothetical predicted protein [Lecanosticta acicola]
MAPANSTSPHKRKLPPRASPSSVEHLAQISWLRPYLDDHDFRIIPDNRTVTNDGRGHTLMGKTWNTESTIKALLSFWRPPPEDLRGKDITELSLPMPESTRPEVRRFCTLGPDLNAHPDLLHGGVISCLLDSCLGGCVGMLLSHSRDENPMFTVQLHVTYKKPIKTPGTVMLRAWVVKIEEEGRKVWAEGVVEGEGNIVHASAQGMWLRAGKKQHKL